MIANIRISFHIARIIANKKSQMGCFSFNVQFFGSI